MTPHYAGLPLDRANRRTASPVVRPRPRVHPRRAARGSRLAAVTQSISHSVGPRRATRWDLRAYTLCGHESCRIFTRARGLSYGERPVIVAVCVRANIFFSASLSFLALKRIQLRVDARYRHGRTCEFKRANTVSRTVASRRTSR